MAVVRDNAFAIAWDVKKRRYEGKRSENLLSALLCSLMKSDQKIAASIFKLFSGRTTSGKIEVNPQPSFSGNEKLLRDNPMPDMLFSNGSVNLIVEVKVDAALGKRQLEDYLELARQQSVATGEEWFVIFVAEKSSETKIHGLVGHAHYLAPKGAAHFYWQDLYDLLRRRGRTKSPWDAGRNAFADFMRDCIAVAGDLYPNYRDLHSGDAEKRKECQQRFYLRYSKVRECFEGFKASPGMNGLEQYLVADKPGIEAFHRYGFLNIIFRWDESKTQTTVNLPKGYLRVFITREKQTPAFPRGEAEVVKPTRVAMRPKTQSPEIATWYRKEGKREAFFFDIAHWIKHANDGPGLTNVLEACGQRIKSYLENVASDG